jgi:hypothetical protein
MVDIVFKSIYIELTVGMGEGGWGTVDNRLRDVRNSSPPFCTVYSTAAGAFSKNMRLNLTVQYVQYLIGAV